MVDDGLLPVGGRPVDVDEHGCGRGYDADAIAAAATATMFDTQWVVERCPPPPPSCCRGWANKDERPQSSSVPLQRRHWDRSDVVFEQTRLFPIV